MIEWIGQTCPNGWSWDPENAECVPGPFAPSKTTCPDGYAWDEASKSCKLMTRLTWPSPTGRQAQTQAQARQTFEQRAPGIPKIPLITMPKPRAMPPKQVFEQRSPTTVPQAWMCPEGAAGYDPVRSKCCPPGEVYSAAKGHCVEKQFATSGVEWLGTPVKSRLGQIPAPPGWPAGWPWPLPLGWAPVGWPAGIQFPPIAPGGAPPPGWSTTGLPWPPPPQIWPFPVTPPAGWSLPGMSGPPLQTPAPPAPPVPAGWPVSAAWPAKPPCWLDSAPWPPPPPPLWPSDVAWPPVSSAKPPFWPAALAWPPLYPIPGWPAGCPFPVALPTVPPATPAPTGPLPPPPAPKQTEVPATPTVSAGPSGGTIVAWSLVGLAAVRTLFAVLK